MPSVEPRRARPRPKQTLDLPKVTDATSDLVIKLFGNSGPYARTTVRVMSLPMGVAVEIELIVTISATIHCLVRRDGFLLHK
jgi:hypothetical protein